MEILLLFFLTKSMVIIQFSSSSCWCMEKIICRITNTSFCQLFLVRCIEITSNVNHHFHHPLRNVGGAVVLIINTSLLLVFPVQSIKSIMWVGSSTDNPFGYCYS